MQKGDRVAGVSYALYRVPIVHYRPNQPLENEITRMLPDKHVNMEQGHY